MQISTSVGVVQYIRVSLRSIMTTNLVRSGLIARRPGCGFLACLVLAGLVSARSGRGQAGDPLIPIVFATAGRSGLTDRANDLVA